jgi:hypothetical protein
MNPRFGGGFFVVAVFFCQPSSDLYALENRWPKARTRGGVSSTYKLLHIGSPLSFCSQLVYSMGIPDSRAVRLTFATTGDPHG